MTLGDMELIDRVRAYLPTAVEKRMFGGTGFMVDGALACSFISSEPHRGGTVVAPLG